VEKSDLDGCALPHIPLSVGVAAQRPPRAKLLRLIATAKNLFTPLFSAKNWLFNFFLQFKIPKVFILEEKFSIENSQK
jgi:hypothetical protein